MKWCLIVVLICVSLMKDMQFRTLFFEEPADIDCCSHCFSVVQGQKYIWTLKDHCDQNVNAGFMEMTGAGRERGRSIQQSSTETERRCETPSIKSVEATWTELERLDMMKFEEK